MRTMGLDLGTKNIGVAISDETNMLATGREVVFRTTDAEAAQRICEIIEEFKVGKIVVGYPINMNGTLGLRAIDSEEFAEMLRQKTKLPVELWDERLSTKEAEDVMIRASVRRQKRKKVIDKLAAQLILQGYLDSL